jgi:hypothetical protein
LISFLFVYKIPKILIYLFSWESNGVKEAVNDELYGFGVVANVLTNLAAVVGGFGRASADKLDIGNEHQLLDFSPRFSAGLFVGNAKVPLCFYLITYNIVNNYSQ